MPGCVPNVPIEELWSSYQELGSLAAVAERHGYAGANTVWKRFRDANLPRHPKHVTVEARYVCPIEDLIAVFEQTQDYHAVAQAVSSTYGAVKQRLRHAGYTKARIHEAQ